MLQVTPANFTFAIWGVIYIFQVLWVGYAWTFVCRPKTPHTISSSVNVGYAAVNALNIIWLYMWGNLHIVTSCAVLFTLNVFFYSTISTLVGYFCKVSAQVDKLDQTLTWIFPINGLFIYATWTTVASLINLSVVLEYTSSIGVSAVNSGTIALSILSAALVVYFVLENTVLFNVLRYVLAVYPVVIWALVGELFAHWGVKGDKRNSKFDLGLLVVTVALFIVRLGRVGFHVFKPCRRYDALSV